MTESNVDKLIATIDGQVRNPKHEHSTVKVEGGTTGNVGQHKTVLLKLFTPDAQASWYLTEYDPEIRMFFGFCNLGDDQNAELGYVSRDELEALRGGLGLPVERDMHWTACPLADVQNFEVR